MIAPTGPAIANEQDVSWTFTIPLENEDRTALSRNVVELGDHVQNREIPSSYQLS